MNPYQNKDKILKKWFSGPKIVRNKVKDPNACPSEYVDQVKFCRWLRDNSYKFASVPNSTWTSFSQQHKNTASGVSRGVPDLFVIVGGRLVWIEMKKLDRKPKRGGKGGLSDEQIEWIEALNGCEGVTAHVAYGAEEAIDIIKTLEFMAISEKY